MDEEPIIIASVAPILFVILGIIVLKICLKITKAEKRTDIKWILISIGLQVGVVMLCSIPIILAGFSGAFNDEGPPPEMFPVLFLAIFININLVNILYEVGIGKSIFIFLVFMIPLGFFMFMEIWSLVQILSP
ncbi:MAG: hypothetical protein JXA99_16830 [Candidatus Lokiarchaeota archaeon]|nr:hypothetical protein [Candidatus Lokiarchaeota archaeon]